MKNINKFLPFCVYIYIYTCFLYFVLGAFVDFFVLYGLNTNSDKYKESQLKHFIE